MGGRHSRRAPPGAHTSALNEQPPAALCPVPYMPNDVWLLIIEKLHPFDLYTTRSVCRAWRALVRQYLASPRHKIDVDMRRRDLWHLLQGCELRHVLGFDRKGNLYIIQNKPYELAIYDRDFVLTSACPIPTLEDDQRCSWVISGGALSVDSDEVLLVLYPTVKDSPHKTSYFTCIFDLNPLRPQQSLRFGSASSLPCAVVFSSELAAIVVYDYFTSYFARRPDLEFVQLPIGGFAPLPGHRSRLAVISGAVGPDSESNNLYLQSYPPLPARNPVPGFGNAELVAEAVRSDKRGIHVKGLGQYETSPLFSIFNGFLCLVRSNRSSFFAPNNVLELTRRDGQLYQIQLPNDCHWHNASVLVRCDGLILVARGGETSTCEEVIVLD